MTAARAGFTLVEILAAMTICAAVVITAAAWSSALEHRATIVQADGTAVRALAQAAGLLRHDLLLTPVLPGASSLSGRLTIQTLAPDPGHPGLHPVTWSLSDGQLTRTVPAGNFVPEQALPVASHIDSAALVIGDDGRLRLHLAAGTHALDLALLPSSSRGP